MLSEDLTCHSLTFYLYVRKLASIKSYPWGVYVHGIMDGRILDSTGRGVSPVTEGLLGIEEVHL